jgi:hypothetical protein
MGIHGGCPQPPPHSLGACDLTIRQSPMAAHFYLMRWEKREEHGSAIRRTCSD